MQIFIDASRALHPKPTGIEVYSREIIRHLLRLPEANQHRWHLLTPARPVKNHDLADLPDHAEWQVVAGKRFWTWWSLSRFFMSIDQPQTSTLFVPGHTLPIITPYQSVLTLHDFAFRYYPELYGFWRTQFINWELARSAHKANQIIVPSERTAHDLARLYQIPQEKIHIIPHGIDHQLYSPSHTKRPTDILKKEPYFLFVGRFDGRKNLKRILHAYCRLLEEKPTSPNFVIVGRPGNMQPSLDEFIRELPASIRKKIHMTGHVPQADLVGWFQGAVALVFPSLYEGFGFPVLEAMASGTPVITSRTSSLSEVAGSAALLVDPTDIPKIAQAMEQLLSDQKLHERLRQKGLARARGFTWEATALATYKILTRG